jgi:hypothetical protein
MYGGTLLDRLGCIEYRHHYCSLLHQDSQCWKCVAPDLVYEEEIHVTKIKDSWGKRSEKFSQVVAL